MKIQKISTGYVPRPWQAHVHANMKRFNCLVLHRRAGKTVMIINDYLDRALRNPLPNPQYAYLAPTYGQAKRIAWDYLKFFTKNIPGVSINESELRIDIPREDRGDRIRFMLLGAENPDALRGLYLDRAGLDEYASMAPNVWGEVIRPALSDRLGGADFLGTPKGTNHFHDMYQLALREAQKENSSWFAFMLRASESKIIPQTELDEARAAMSEEEYEQEYECSFTAALIGAYYGPQIKAIENEKRITGVPYDPAVPVHLAWDLGIGDTTAIWFAQQVGKEVHLIDYMEDCGQDLSFYVRELKRKPYVYGEILLPHDANARELGTGKTRVEQLRSLGLGRLRVLPRQSVEDGIAAARALLPKCWFDGVKTPRGFNALKNYQRKWDPKNQVFSTAPMHNWASNGSDAFRQLALGLRPERPRFNVELPTHALSDYDIYGRM